MAAQVEANDRGARRFPKALSSLRELAAGAHDAVQQDDEQPVAFAGERSELTGGEQGAVPHRKAADAGAVAAGDAGRGAGHGGMGELGRRQQKQHRSGEQVERDEARYDRSEPDGDFAQHARHGRSSWPASSRQIKALVSWEMPRLLRLRDEVVFCRGGIPQRKSVFRAWKKNVSPSMSRIRAISTARMVRAAGLQTAAWIFAV